MSRFICPVISMIGGTSISHHTPPKTNMDLERLPPKGRGETFFYPQQFWASSRYFFGVQVGVISSLDHDPGTSLKIQGTHLAEHFEYQMYGSDR